MKKFFGGLLTILCCLMLLGSCGSSEEVDHTGQAQIPSSSMKGRDYMEVMEEYEENGFTNVRSEKIEDLVFSWLTDDGEVEEVLIDGSADYSKEEWIPDDTEIIVRYHTFENEDEEVANINEIEETDVTRNVDFGNFRGRNRCRYHRTSNYRRSFC